MAWGAHVCVFYETKQDLLDTCAAYFAAGLEGGEHCVWAISDPVTQAEAREALAAVVRDLAYHEKAGHIEIIDGREWYLDGEAFDLHRVTRGWSEKLEACLAKGFSGMRISGNAFWMASEHWDDFCAYECEVDQTLSGKRMLVLCTYALKGTRATDLLDVVRFHQFSVARRQGEWEFVESPSLTQAKREIRHLRSAVEVLAEGFPGQELLTSRERLVLAQLIKGSSYKDAGRELGISARTIEFHRNNIVKKLGAKNTGELVYRVLREQ